MQSRQILDPKLVLHLAYITVSLYGRAGYNLAVYTIEILFQVSIRWFPIARWMLAKLKVQ